MSEWQLIARWRNAADVAAGWARKHELEYDGANAHAFRKERRIWTTCADELEAALTAHAEDTSMPPDEFLANLREAVEMLTTCPVTLQDRAFNLVVVRARQLVAAAALAPHPEPEK